MGVSLAFHQSNHEGELIDLVQSAREAADAIVINPAAFSFTSIGLLDALKAFDGPVVEVHISNIHARDKLQARARPPSCSRPATSSTSRSRANGRRSLASSSGSRRSHG